MRPHRVRLTHSLVENYNLNQRMLVHRPEARSKEQIENFHCDGTPLCQVLNSHCRFPGPARMLELQSIQLTLPSHHCNRTSLTLHSHSAAFTLELLRGCCIMEGHCFRYPSSLLAPFGSAAVGLLQIWALCQSNLLR